MSRNQLKRADVKAQYSASKDVSRYVGLCLAFSVVVNLLMLVSPLYMLQIYDRIMTSGSMDALIWLSVMAVGLMAVYAAAEAGRRRVLSLAGDQFSDELSKSVFDTFLGNSEAQPKLAHNLTLVSRLQNLIQSGVPTAFFDLPFTPFFLILLTVLHPIFGVLGLVGTVLIILVAIAAELQSRRPAKTAGEQDVQARQFAQGLERQRSAIASMGIGAAAKEKWHGLNTAALRASTESTSLDGVYSGLSRTIRQVLQILALGVGAALAINQHISAGGIVAGSILMGRALAPIDQVVGNWRGLVKGKSAWNELKSLRDESVVAPLAMALPRPDVNILVSGLGVRVPGSENDLIKPFSFAFPPSDIVALLGPNGCGKTTLLQVLSGAWKPASGSVSLGGRDIHDWALGDRGKYVGYLPQLIELLPGTVRDNICRMADADDVEIFKAAEAVGAHKTILALSNGYETNVGAGGVHLSAGQRQMIGLARAMFRQPVALFLDEPTANLDHVGCAGLIAGLKAAKKVPSCIVISTHDPRILSVADTVMVIRDGKMMSAPASEYLAAQYGAKTVNIRPELVK